MGYVLLLIESLATTLLAVATVLACAGRFQRPWQRHLLWLPVTAILLALYTALAVGAGLLRHGRISDWWFFPLLALAVAFLVGAAWLAVRGLRASGEPPRPAAAGWPRGKLAVALGVAAALHAMTLWNMDLAARQQLAALRTEAGAIALSAAPPRIPDRENAALVYQQAFEAMGRFDKNPAAPGAWEWEQAWKDAWGQKWSKWDETGEAPLDTRDPGLRRFLAREAAALSLLRQAAAKPGCYFDRDWGRPTIAMPLPELLLLRNGARVLALDALASAADGDRQRAIGDINAMLGMAEHIRSDSLLFSLFVSMVVDRLAIDSMQVVLESAHVPAEEVPPQWFLNDVSYRRTFRRALRTEEVLRLATFAQVGEGEYSITDIIALAQGNDPGTEGALGITALGYRVFLLADDLAAQARFTTDIDALARQPFWQVKDRLQEYDQQLRSHPRGLMNAVLMPAMTRIAQHIAVAEARRDAARIGLALYRYRAQHGRLPDTLGELAPQFIPLVPTDPFDGQPLRFKRAGQGAIVSSVGPDTILHDNSTLFDIDRKHRNISFTVPDQGPASNQGPVEKQGAKKPEPDKK